MNKSKVGRCHLCGADGELSFEHIPPKAAFNNHGVLEADIHRLLGHDPREEGLKDKVGGKTNQRGAGGFTLCKSCNNNTGSWYGPAYVDFTHQAVYLRHKIAEIKAESEVGCSSDSSADAIIRIKPLNVLKQMLVMFCSACQPILTENNPRLVRFLLNKEMSFPGYDMPMIALSLFDIENSVATRQSGISGVIDKDTGAQRLYSEISFPPFNIVMALEGGPA